jgi:hypothetical protein
MYAYEQNIIVGHCNCGAILYASDKEADDKRWHGGDPECRHEIEGNNIEGQYNR